MTPERWRAVKEIFDKAVQLEGSDRSAYLHLACREDASLRAEVCAMLKSDAAAGTFLDNPAPGVPDMAAMEVMPAGMPAAGSMLGQYRIVSELGAGGMGRVYRAEDTRLGRTVALKVLAPPWGDDPAARARFEGEARLAAALDHPNICTIYEVGHDAGLPFIAMQFVDGETLQTVLRRGPLPLDGLLSIGRQIADALSAAHARGIIHRDVKSSNVMLTSDGGARVLDFGVAKLLERMRAPAWGPDATLRGTVVGTPAYLSPEAARGEEVDYRTDVFSLGVVLYEMATGRRPFEGRTGADTIAAVLTQPHSPAAEINPSLPASLVDVVDRALAKDPNHRFQSIEEIRSALQRVTDAAVESRPERPRGDGSSGEGSGTAAARGRSQVRRRLGVAAATLMIAGVGLTGLTVLRNGRPIDSIAVMPFASSGPSEDLEYLGDGIAEGVIQRLAELPATRVLARSTSFAYKGSSDALTTGRKLGVRTVLTGDVARENGMLVVRAELVDVESGARLWGNTYRRPFSVLSALPGEVARTLSEELQTRLTREQERRLARNDARNSDAYQQYLRGRFFWNKRTADGYVKAIELFTAAVTADPTFALAYSGLADSYSILRSYGIRSTEEMTPLARGAAERAVQIDPELAEAHTSLAKVSMDTLAWKEAEGAFARAIALNPNYATAHHWQAMYLAEVGRIAEALPAIRRAQALDPLSLIINTEVGRLLYFARDYDAAIAQLSGTLELDRDFAPAHLHLGSVLLEKRRFSEAQDEFRKAAALGGAMPAVGVASASALAGDRRPAEALLREMLGASRERPYALALLYVTLDDHERAMDWIERGLTEGGPWFLAVNPKFDPLQPHARYQAILRRLGINR